MQNHLLTIKNNQDTNSKKCREAELFAIPWGHVLFVFDGRQGVKFDGRFSNNFCLASPGNFWDFEKRPKKWRRQNSASHTSSANIYKWWFIAGKIIYKWENHQYITGWWLYTYPSEK